MKLIITALFPEAKPFIEQLKLKKDLSIKTHQVFKNEDTALIISGIGAIKSAIATTLLISRYSDNRAQDPIALLSVGIAASSKEMPIGEAYLINKISDQNTNTHYYPEMLLKSKTLETSLLTVSSPCSDFPKELSPSTLIDMEASGTLQAASTFLSTEQIVVFKVISDHCSPTDIKKNNISPLISKHIETFCEKLNQTHQYLRENRPQHLPPEHNKILEQLTKHLKLTQSQQRMLSLNLLSNKVNQKKLPAQIQQTLLVESPTSKGERNTVFQEILDAITK